MTNEDISKKRLALQARFGQLLGVKYKFGFEWTDLSKNPEFTDCSESVEGVCHQEDLECPDGSQNQFNFMIPIKDQMKPQVGDFAFFGRNKDPKQIYHVGMVYDASRIIEARGYDEKAHFKTGEVILRPIEKWINYSNFIEFRSHPLLIGA